MKKLTKTIFFLLLVVNSASSQSVELLSACESLKNALYKVSFELDGIKNKLNNYQEALKSSSQLEYENCNCADTIWLASYRNSYPYLKETNRVKIDTLNFLNSIPHELDIMNLAQEFKLQRLNHAQDSFEYVLDRLEEKNTQKRFIYNLITAELAYLKKKKSNLRDSYFVILDDTLRKDEIKDVILNALFSSDELVAKELAKRIGKQQYDKHFYRMYGAFNTSNKKPWPEVELNILENLDYDIEKEKINIVLKSLLQAPNGIRIKRKPRKRLIMALSNPQLNELPLIEDVLIKLQKENRRVNRNKS